MEGKWPCCRWRVVLIICTLSVVGFVIQTFILRNDTFALNKQHALHVLQKVFHHWSPPGTREPESGGPPGLGRERWKATPSPGCQHKSHIVFLNTHTTDSSAIQNILYRYGEQRNLTFALPKGKDVRFPRRQLFQAQFVEGVDSSRVKEFHIMCNQMRFRKSEVAKVMPEDTLYFSMLRHPVPLVQSAFLYSKVVTIFGDSHDLDMVVEDSLRNSTSPVDESGFTLNKLAFDFGFDNVVSAGDEDLEQRAAEVIVDIEKDFHLLLIHEYFDESLILLRHTLCWSLEDVATFRPSRRSDQTHYSVSAETAEDIRQWNALDWKIYQHFNATFWHKVESVVGVEQMQKEVSDLRELQAELTRTCLEGKMAHPEVTWQGREVSLGFNLNPGLNAALKRKCQKLVTPALQYTYKLYDQQFP
ncbi:galactose-3-O-sulfotransferase 2-like [Salarias fasciatus]|uniref:galactose-3-O-sulfotransferase 2-like n=1 Tax=Salarias fasciatus TaxID=181472 RepID=UPI00117654B3|nr:galactose-3-O-sulfotransferase 2-like [Salarias fasciatus]